MSQVLGRDTQRAIHRPGSGACTRIASTNGSAVASVIFEKFPATATAGSVAPGLRRRMRAGMSQAKAEQWDSGGTAA